MSRLTEIMKQIPLDELTGDVEMKESNNRKIEVTSGGAMVGRRVGAIGTAAACAVLAAGGVFAYSRLSASPDDGKQAAPITSTAEGHSDVYSRNLAAYKEFYEKTLGADFSLVEKNVSPLEEESGVAELEGLKLRVIGTRSIGAMLRVDIIVENPEKKYYYFQRDMHNASLILPDGSSVDGFGAITQEQDADAESAVISFAFPGYFKSGDRLKLTVDSIRLGNITDLNESDHSAELKDYSAEFTYTSAVNTYDYTIETDTVSTWPSLDPAYSEDISVRVKEISYSAAGAALRFSIGNVPEDYTEKVLDLLCGGKISGYDKTKYASYDDYAAAAQGFAGDMAYAASDEGCLRYLTRFSSENLWLLSRNGESSDLILYNDFLDDPLPVEKITKFVFGTEKAEAAVLMADADPSDSSWPEYSGPVDMDDVSITFDGVKVHLKNTDQASGYTAETAFTVTDLPYEFDFAKTVSVQLQDGSKFAPENGVFTKAGYLPENNINPHATYTFLIDLDKHGISDGDTLTLMIDDLYDVDGNKIASGHYEKDFTVSYPVYDSTPDDSTPDDSTPDDSRPDNTLTGPDTDKSSYYVEKALLYNWETEDGISALDKSTNELFEQFPASEKSGFPGIDMGVAALIRGTASEDEISRYLAPVIIISCEDRDDRFLSTDPDKALGVNNEIYLKTEDGRIIASAGEGWAADGTDTLICAPTFDLAGCGLKKGDRVTLYVEKLLSGAGYILAEGEFITELTL